MVAVVNKCNITSYVLSRLSKFREGKYCVDDNPILDNYVDYTGCIERGSCYEDTCVNDAIFVPCNIAITGMVREIEEDMANIFLVDSNIIHGQPPYTYEWDFDERTFDLVGGKYGDTLTIVLKDGKTFDAVVSVITCLITDALGCKAAKACYIDPTGMHCESSYAYCANPMDLSVINTQTYCPKPTGLIVSKKS